VTVRNFPNGVAVTPDGAKVYVSNKYDNNVSVIDTATNTVTTTIPVGNEPLGIAVTPDGTKVYVANEGVGSESVSVIDTATNTVTATVPGLLTPIGVSVTPDGTKVYVASWGNDTVSVIDTSTDNLITNVPVGHNPVAFGQFIGKIPLIPGSFVYTPPSGTILGAGQGQTLSVSFTPTDTANYTSCSGTNTINVSQYQASISWPPIANITYPTPLSGTQLNAVAN
jgi:YVTN family beta-propeller protein